MNGAGVRTTSGLHFVVAAWAMLAIAASTVALPQIDRLGLYYDEAFLAQQARDFVEPGRAAQHAGSVRSVELFGRPFPVRNAAYLGSLKSQLLIPAFLVAGANVETLRIATFATAWLALLIAMLWTTRILPWRVAVVSGVLIASDPSFLFFGLFEWGPFTTNLLCRATGLLLLTLAWQSRSSPRGVAAAAAGGVAFGLGVFSRADFAVIIAAFGLGVVIGHWTLVRQALREQRGALAAAGVGLLTASAPMWLSVLSLLGASGAIADRGDLAFRSSVLWRVLDGSQFHRLMQTGGVFETAQAVGAPAGVFGAALLLALGIVGWDLFTAARRDPAAAQRDPRRLLWIATLVTLLAMLAMPGAVRAHHQLNVLPFAQILVACAAEVVWRRRSDPTATGRRAAVGLALAVIVIANVRVIAATTDEIASTAGRGRWTRALHTLADELESETGAEAVSLDWGFHEPLLFLTDAPPLSEAIWAIPRSFAAGRPWVHAGNASTRYLVHDAGYDLFGLGPLFLAFARAQPAGSVAIEPRLDGDGDVAFYAIRILRPHRLSYTGRFKVD